MKEATTHRFPALVLLALAAAAGCADDATGPELVEGVTIAQVAGSYETSIFVGHAEGGDTDVVAAGGYIALTLHSDGTTEGTMFVPEGDEDGSDYTADLTGTWGLNTSNDIVFDHDADTFIRDVTWQYYDDGTIRTDNAFARVVLARE